MSNIYDYLIVGSGLGGLLACLEIADDKKIALVSKNQLNNSNSFYAQGGISCVRASKDSFDQHIADTLKSGDDLCQENIVTQIINQAPFMLEKLAKYGIVFSKDKNNNFILTNEGGHSQNRVHYIEDKTGNIIISSLLKLIQKKHNIDIFEYHQAIDLIDTNKFNLKNNQNTNDCLGAYILDINKNKLIPFLAHNTILASGGCGMVYRHSTNPSIATGDGIAMAYRAGLDICNMEFFQFHPTCLFANGKANFLISEAVRGEGGILKCSNKEGFYPLFSADSPNQDLNTRDIVARAIDKELKTCGAKNIYLDITHKKSSFLQARFPTIFKKCLQLGIDIHKDLIPVVPAAHYCCGGVQVNIDGTNNKIANLYIIGENAHTGFHGANRLASNSLLEVMVMSYLAIKKSNTVNNKYNLDLLQKIPPYQANNILANNEKVIINHNWSQIRSLMWDYVGIFRSSKRLNLAKSKLSLIREEINYFYNNYQLNHESFEVRNMIDVAQLIVNSALMRKESRGLHYNIDFPNKSPHKQDTIISICKTKY